MTIRKMLKNPYEDANFISRATFSYFLPTFIAGYRKYFEEEDLFETLKEHESSKLGDALENAWKREKRKDNPSFARALFKIFGGTLMKFAIITILLELVFKVAQTLALGKLIYYFNPEQTEISKGLAYVYTTVIVLCSFANVLFGHNYVMHLQHLGMKMRVACCSLIYRKSLKMSQVSLSQTTTGQIINLLSNDVNRFDLAPINAHNLWVTPLQTIFIMYLVYRLVGWTGIVGVCFVLLFFPLQIYLGKKLSVLRLKTALKTDERVRLMNEIITGIKIIKMYAWEIPFTKLAHAARKLEIRHIKASSYIKGCVVSFSNFIASLALFLSILTYVATGNTVRAEYVFVLSSFYHMLRQSMTLYLPAGINQCAEAWISIKRLEKFLLLEEKDERANTNRLDDVKIEIVHGTAKWIESLPDNTLNDVSLTIGKNELVVVIGYVGSGKSSLMQVILKELPLIYGSLTVNGTISYASQDPWIFGGTIKDNIIFGRKYDEKRYLEVISVCALEKDFDFFPEHDVTLIGERGVTLSGGQRARINLARAVYKESDIYLLDDPLAAVDAFVARRIYEECVLRFLKEKCVVLVTNQLQFLKNAERIVFLKKGRVAIDGSYGELRQSDLDFTKLLKGDDESDDLIVKRKDSIVYKHKNVELVQEKEFKHTESVDFNVYVNYLRAGGSLAIFSMVFILFLIAQLSASGSDYFLAFWTNVEQIKSTNNSTNVTYEPNNFKLPLVYAILVILMVMIFFTRSIAFFAFSMRASVNLHDSILSRIVGAPLRFFQQNPSGRILNRFSKDIGTIDEILPGIIIDALQITFIVFGVMIIVGIINPHLLPLSVIILILFWGLRSYYLATSRNLKRLEGITKSPVFTHMNTSLQGLTTIRAFDAQDTLRDEFDSHQNLHSSAYFMFFQSSRTFGFWLDLLCAVYVGIIIFSVLLIGKEEHGGNVGLVVTQSIMIVALFQWGIRQWGEVENQMTSVERILEYRTVEQEEETVENKIARSKSGEYVITYGSIEFRNVSLKYDNDVYALRDVNFFVHSREKVGIVGRTGAGKSSLISALFRLTPYDGEIFIDDQNIAELTLSESRSNISIIPQDPVLFSGTLRKNLDPFKERTDPEVWSALDDVEMKTVIAELPAGLYTKVSENGLNFSVGQRQLLCLARAIVKKNKILVLDEATANVDPKTDSLIQETIRKKFNDCTVLTIAHRLNTVIDSDRILVIDSGTVKEFDHAHRLLERKGIFYRMVQQLGNAMAENLSEIAKTSYQKKKR